MDLNGIPAHTSRLNPTGVHYSDADLRALLGYHERVWHLRLLATSCRVVTSAHGPRSSTG